MVHCIKVSKTAKINQVIKGYNVENVCLSLKIVFILANSVGPYEMPHNAAFHMGLHCLPEYALRRH